MRSLGVARYPRLFALQLRMSLSLGMQYRWNFILDGGLALAWAVVGVVPLAVAFSARPVLGGWSYEGALVVLGWFTLLKGVLDGAVNPSLIAVVEHIRQGTLDFVLLKPADAQFLVSTSKFEPWRVVDVAVALALFGWAFSRMGRVPAAADVALSLVLLAAAVMVLYSVWILVVSAAFWVVRVDNLSYLFNSIFDFARWPASVFKGIWRVVFTVVVPLALMTTFPAQALLGELALRSAGVALLGSLVFTGIARLVWTAAIRRYTSASS